jgi:hypothetical protein
VAIGWEALPVLTARDRCFKSRTNRTPSDNERAKVFAGGPSPDRQLFERSSGSMLGNDPRRIELAYSLLFGLLGCQDR